MSSSNFNGKLLFLAILLSHWIELKSCNPFLENHGLIFKIYGCNCRDRSLWVTSASISVFTFFYVIVAGSFNQLTQHRKF